MSELFPETIETDRLRLDAIDHDSIDVFDLYDAYADDPDLEEVMRYVPIDPFETVDDAVEFVENAIESRESGDAATYAIRPREPESESGAFAGTTTIFVHWDRRSAEFAIVLRKGFWGRGYSGERAEAFVELAFDRLDLEVVTVACAVENENSRRAIERYVDACGGRYDGRFRNAHVIDDEPVDLDRFSITSDQYAEAIA